MQNWVDFGTGTLSFAKVSFVFPVSWGMERGEIKRTGGGEKRNESVQGTLGRERKRVRPLPFCPSRRPLHAPDLSISLFSLSFPHFLTISPLKEPLQRREAQGNKRWLEFVIAESPPGVSGNKGKRPQNYWEQGNKKKMKRGHGNGSCV